VEGIEVDSASLGRVYPDPVDEHEYLLRRGTTDADQARLCDVPVFFKSHTRDGGEDLGHASGLRGRDLLGRDHGDLGRQIGGGLAVSLDAHLDWVERLWFFTVRRLLAMEGRSEKDDKRQKRDGPGLQRK
jgi:hypothetical protein